MKLRRSTVAIFLPFLIVLLAMMFSPKKCIDDAYISFRYAAQLVQGNGLVFNPHEYVEGYSNFLWTLLLTIPLMLGISIEGFAYFLGLLAGLLTLFLLYRLLIRLAVPPVIAVAALTAFALYLPFWYAATNGLEAGMYACGVLFAVYLALRARTGPDFALLSGTGGLLWLIRPEGLGVALLLLLYSLSKRYNGKLSRAVPVLLPFGVILLLTLAVRYLTYGSLVPNTLVAKPSLLKVLDQPEVFVHMLRLGRDYLIETFSVGVLLVTLMLALVGVVKGKAELSLRLLLAGIFGYSLLVILLSGGDWMPHSRLLAHNFPILAVLATTGLHASLPEPKRYQVAAAGIWILAGILSFSSMYTPITAVADITRITSRPCNTLIGQSLNTLSRKDLLIASPVIGALSYYALDFRVHDMLGLTDAVVAATGEPVPRFGSRNYAYTHSLNPDIYVFGNAGVQQQQLLTRYGYPENYRIYLIRACQPDIRYLAIRDAVSGDAAPLFNTLDLRQVTLEELL